MATYSYDLVQQRVSSLLQQMGVPGTAITPQAHFTRDLGLDSLDTVDLMMRMGQEFFLSISDEQMSSIQTVNQAIHFLTEELSFSKASPSQPIKSVYPDEFTLP